jgi:hypothetical protein
LDIKNLSWNAKNFKNGGAKMTKLPDKGIEILKLRIVTWHNEGYALFKILFDMEANDWGSACSQNIRDIKTITDKLKLRLYEIENDDLEEMGC